MSEGFLAYREILRDEAEEAYRTELTLWALGVRTPGTSDKRPPRPPAILKG